MNRRERRLQQKRKARPVASPAVNAPEPPCEVVPSAPAETSAPPALAASTGPRTPEGKAASSRNAVRHGLTARRLTGADLDEYNSIRSALDLEWEPDCEAERHLLHLMALSQWRINRALSLELSAFDDTHIDPALLALALRYRTASERAYFKALSELQRLRATIIADQRRAAVDEDDALTQELERICYAPIGTPSRLPLDRQFVSQKFPQPPAAQSSTGSQRTPPLSSAVTIPPSDPAHSLPDQR
jgi:hypothetical protein